MTDELSHDLTPQMVFLVDSRRRVVAAENMPHAKLPQLRKVTFGSPPRRASIRQPYTRRDTLKGSFTRPRAEDPQCRATLTRVILWGNQQGVSIKPPWKSVSPLKSQVGEGERYSPSPLQTKSSFDGTRDESAISFLKTFANERSSKLSDGLLNSQSSSPLRRTESEAVFCPQDSRLQAKSTMLLPKLKPCINSVRITLQGASTERLRATARIKK